MSNGRKDDSKEVKDRPNTAPTSRPSMGATARKHSGSDGDKPLTEGIFYQTDEKVAENGRQHLQNELHEKNSFLMLTGSPTPYQSLYTAAGVKTPEDLKNASKPNIIIFNSHGLPSVINHEHLEIERNKATLAKEEFAFDLDSFALTPTFRKDIYPGLPHTKECKSEGIPNSKGITKIPLYGTVVIAPVCYESDLQMEVSAQAKKLNSYLSVFRDFAKHTTTLPGKPKLIPNIFLYFSEYFEASDGRTGAELKAAEKEKIELWMMRFGSRIIDEISRVYGQGGKAVHVIHRDNWVDTFEYTRADRMSRLIKDRNAAYEQRFNELLSKGNLAYFMRKHQDQLTPIQRPTAPVSAASLVNSAPAVLTTSSAGSTTALVASPASPAVSTAPATAGSTGKITLLLKPIANQDDELDYDADDEADSRHSKSKNSSPDQKTIFEFSFNLMGSPTVRVITPTPGTKLSTAKDKAAYSENLSLMFNAIIRAGATIPRQHPNAGSSDLAAAEGRSSSGPARMGMRQAMDEDKG